MSDDFSSIRPKQVPLSHAEPEPLAAGRGTRFMTWSLGAVLASGLLILVFFFLPTWLEPIPPPPSASPAPSGGVNLPSVISAPAAQSDEALPPFQQLQREQARIQAQEQLAQFVERQIQLEKNMQVGAWGAEAYQQAKDLAAAGDEAFLREQFEASVDNYRAATAKLADLIERGRGLLEETLEEGTAALAERDQARAQAAFALATTIAPDDPRVVSGNARLALLPEISTLMREARNQELADDWPSALATYERVKALDSATNGLDDAMNRVAQGRQRTRVQTLLSQAFARLDEARFEAARAAFRDALALDPGNAVAAGGLEQVAKRADVARINELRRQAEQAEKAERWEDAASVYSEVLALDSTIRFAQNGRAQALAQQRTRTALANIVQSPDRLSSDKLYLEAHDILSRAEALEPRGTKLASQIEDVRAILATYAKPVAVVLRSDNLTQVTLSTVGPLGSFTEKRLQLRPGGYTVTGSRDGCRDVRERIVVRPNMSPVDIRCVETL